MTILVVDIGSSSVRALLFDAQANLIPGAVVAKPHQFITTPPGAAIFEVASLQARVEDCLDTLLQHPQALAITAFGMATFVGNMLGVDAHQRPITPLYSYADTRSAADVQQLKSLIDPAAAHQRTGCPPHTAYHPGRLRWLQRTDPTLFAGVHQWMDIGTYLYTQWLGASPCSYSVASWSGLLNRHTLQWDEQWLATLHLSPHQLPLLADYMQAQQGLRAPYAERWPVLKNVPFFLAVGDGAAANVGCGCVDPSRLTLTLGTTGAMRMITAAPVATVPAGLWAYRVDQTHTLLGGATSEGGNIFEWLSRTIQLPPTTTLEQALASLPADQHGLTVLPLLAGERSPGWAAHATGAIIGLRMGTTPLDIAQAALEGVALRLALLAEQIATAIPVVGNGGALEASPAWTQIIANALDRPIHLLATREVAGRGVALLVLRALYGHSLADFPPAFRAVITPQPEQVSRLQAAKGRQQQLYQQVIAGA